MVAKINTPAKLARALNYNEHKVRQGAAELIWASGYVKALGDLNFYEKLERFEDLIALNRSNTNSLHISLNFSNEDVLSKEKLIQLTDDYMDLLGFGEQPYLVYQHHDAAHPHVHIVTCSIKPDGRRIDTWKIGQLLSRPACVKLEETYGLVQTGDKANAQAWRLKPVNAEQVKYGKSPTKRAITNVLDAVLKRYQYGSLAELNALLRLYNVEAALVHERGIVYRVVGSGVAVKASDIYSKPTLEYLEERFAGKKADGARIKNMIELALQMPLRWQQFVSELKFRGISVVERRSESGRLYGLTFIDHRDPCVMNGSALGKAYSAMAILARCKPEPGLREEQLPDLDLKLTEGIFEQMDFELKGTRKRRKKQKPE